MTPLFAALTAYLNKNPARFHMPGHKGILPYPLDVAAAFDVTEVQGLDSLYEASGAIAALEREYALIYGSAASFLSAGGSTLCIQAMLALCLRPGEKLVCGRGVHSSAVNTMALLGLEPCWVYPKENGEGIAGAISPEDIAAALDANPDARAVLITSPDYHGAICDTQKIADICHSHGIPLLVDNAHGAHLKFLPDSLHPMDNGADICADSLHKTLPALTGGAMLHIKNPALISDAKRRMAFFGSTSPNYLIMLSCDMALDYIKSHAREDVTRLKNQIDRLKKLAVERGFFVPSGLSDPTRLVLGFSGLGYTGKEFGEYIRTHGMEPEYLSESFCVFMAGPGSTDEDFSVLEKAIAEIPPKTPVAYPKYIFPRPEAVMPVREAVFAEAEKIPLDLAEGRIASGMVCPCPPGMALIVPGEKISADMVSCLKNYGILEINVLR